MLRRLFLCFVVGVLLVSPVISAGNYIALQGTVKQSGLSLASGDLKVFIFDSASGGSVLYNSTSDFDIWGCNNSLNVYKKNIEENKFPQRLEHIFTGYVKIMCNNYLNVSIDNNIVEYALVAQRLEQLSNKQCLHRFLGSSPSQGVSTFSNKCLRLKNE